MRGAEREREDQRRLAESALRAAEKARRLHGPQSQTGAFYLRLARAHARLAGGEIREHKR